MFRKTNEEEIIEVISEEVSHNIPALQAKKERLLAEIAEIDLILNEDKKFIKKEDKEVVTFERVSDEVKIGK